MTASSLLTVILLLTTSCGQSYKKNQNDEIGMEDVKEEIMQAADTTAAFLNEEKEVLIAAYHSRLEVARDQIKDYHAMVVNAGDAITKVYSEKVETLEAAANKTERKMDTLVQSSENAWDEFSDGVEMALNDLEKAIKEAKDEFMKHSSD